MKNIKLVIAYDGSCFYGWQRQPGKRTVQSTIEDTIESVFKEKIVLQGASRTDSGVHAKGQVANFKIEKDVALAKIKTALNSKLPKDIMIVSAELVAEDFNARMHAKGKHYQYVIFNHSVHSPFSRHYALFCPYALDTNKMQEAATFMTGTIDFASYGVNPKRDIKSTVKTISAIDIYREDQKEGATVIIDIFGDSFLYKMVRSMVGTLIEVGRGKKAPAVVKEILAQKDRTCADKTVAGCGLYLLEVYY